VVSLPKEMSLALSGSDVASGLAWALEWVERLSDW
jgi:hypothetical protein